MFIRTLLQFLFVALSFRIVEEGGGGSLDTSSAPVSDTSSAVDTPAAPAAPVSSPAPAPTMLDAISAHLDAQQPQANGQPRDQQGRFATKADGTPLNPAAAAPAVPGAPAAPAAPVIKPAAVPGAPEDLTVMPEGLQPKAQERFQKLANTVKEVTTERDEARSQISYVRDTFQQHGIQQSQFEQAAQVIGLMNKGDWNGALQVLDEQRRQISLIMGQALPGVDALSDFPDLRQAVDNLQIAEPHAMEMARARTQQAAAQRQQQQTQQAQQSQQQEQQAVSAGLAAVDRACKELSASDMDFPVIEAQLLPAIKDICGHLPPNQWENAIRTQYHLLKGMASKVRGSSPSQGAVLRPTGQASPGAQPKSMFEAMWNR